MRCFLPSKYRPGTRGVDASATSDPTGPDAGSAPDRKEAWASVCLKELRGFSTDLGTARAAPVSGPPWPCAPNHHPSVGLPFFLCFEDRGPSPLGVPRPRQKQGNQPRQCLDPRTVQAS